MSGEWIGVVGTLAGAVTTFVFQQVTSSKATRAQRVQQVRAEQLATFTEFAGSLLGYRRAQIHRRKAVLASRPQSYIDATSNDLRQVRAEAWTAFQRVLLVSSDEEVETAARGVLTTLKSLKEVPAADIDQLGMQVHWEIQQFVMAARDSLPTLSSKRER